MLLNEEKMDPARKFGEKKLYNIIGLRLIVSFFLAYKIGFLFVNICAAQ
jgi:hypothetical protein